MSSDKNILIDVWLVSLLASRLVADVLEESPLAVDEFALYGLIVDLSPITASDLARATGLSPTTISGIIGRCERRGELIKVSDPGDGRRTPLSLTERGIEVHLAAVPGLLKALENLDRAVDRPMSEVRQSLQAFDGALRRVMGIDDRPYSVTPEALGSLDFAGPPLDASQRREVLGYIDWIRERDHR